MRIYLDVCCLNRPFDDQSQERIRLEAEAVVLLLARAYAANIEWVSSEAVDFEVGHDPNEARRLRVGTIAAAAHKHVQIGDEETRRAIALEALGSTPLDALQVACAESGGADVLLSTDDRLLRLAARHRDQVRVAVKNPLYWLLGE